LISIKRKKLKIIAGEFKHIQPGGLGIIVGLGLAGLGILVGLGGCGLLLLPKGSGINSSSLLMPLIKS